MYHGVVVDVLHSIEKTSQDNVYSSNLYHESTTMAHLVETKLFYYHLPSRG
jgi:hypothetical protein